MKEAVSVSINNVSKVFSIHFEKPTLFETFLSGWKQDKYSALTKINITILRGERVGIIGTNGSGKTTILKLIAGIIVPTSGSVEISGRLVSLIDLEAGFHSDLSGLDNLYLNAILLGMTRAEVDVVIKDILVLADLGDFISAPLNTYSSGMKLRLGFSIAINSNPDILLLDENLVVGDKNFQKKISQKLTRIRKNTTILFASHNLEMLKKHCDRVIWLNKGRVVADGISSDITELYKMSKMK